MGMEHVIIPIVGYSIYRCEGKEVGKHQYEAEGRSWIIIEGNWLHTKGRLQAEMGLARDACRGSP